MDQAHYDVVIVGASIGGCTAATFFARRGLKVGLVEQHANSDAYKVLCTHFIQASAVPTMERLGIIPAVEAAGGIRNAAEIWTRWGWIRPPKDIPSKYPTYGYNIRRQTLDPILRTLAAETPGVDLLLGETVRRLVTSEGRTIGVGVDAKNGQSRDITGRLVVAADGRHSRMADLARVPATIKPHNRLAYFAYYRNLSLASGTDSQMWILEPDVAYTFPNEDAVTIVACMPVKEKLEFFKSDLEGSFTRFFEKLPRGPKLSEGERVSKIIGVQDLPNISRPAVYDGLALVGDAALASDPLWGVGCGWAFQSAEWLVDTTADALLGQGNLDVALERYKKQHHSQLSGHHNLIADFATGRDYNLIEKLFYSAAAKDPITARHFAEFGSRNISVRQFLAPSAVARALWVNATRRNTAQPAVVTT